MSLKLVKQELIKFIDSKNEADGPLGNQGRVLALKGRWGIGKTHLWNEVIQQKKDNYIYISLFGIDSLEQLKNEIATNFIKLKGQGGRIKEKYQKYFDGLFNIGNSALKVFSINIPFEKIGFSFVKDSIICFDDIERKGETLDLKDVLGLVSVLKEQRNCKILIILNDDSNLGGSDKETYTQYREKIIDEEIIFLPDIEHSAQLMFTTKSNQDTLIRSICKEYDLSNIRTYTKIKKNIAQVESITSNFPEILKNQIIDSIIRVSGQHWEGKNNLPEQSQNVSYIEAEKNLDDIFTQLIHNGIFDKNSLTSSLMEVERIYSSENKNKEAQDEYQKIFSQIVRSFKFTDDDIVNSIETFCKKYPVTPRQADVIIRALKDIARPDSINIVLQAIKDSKLEEIENAIDHAETFGNSVEPEIIRIRDEYKKIKIEKITKEIKAADVLEEISEKISKGFFNEDDLIKLCALNEMEISSYFLEQDFLTKGHRELLKECISPRVQMKRYADMQEQIKSKFWNVINLITRNSETNRKRLIWMGILPKDNNLRP